MTSQEFIRNAQRIQAGSDNKSPLAIPEYQKAIEVCNEKDEEYELLYAHYQIMWISSHHYPEQAVQYAEKCLELLKPTIEVGAIWHFTEIGQFHKEVIRYATNCIGWNRFSQTDDIAELEKLLELVLMGSQYADAPEYFYVFDTQVRILLKLGRNKEAFSIVQSCLKKDSAFSDFRDIVLQNDYLEWKANFEAGIVSDLTGEEKILLEKAERITAKLKQLIIDKGADKKEFTVTIPEKEIITLGEAKEKYGISSYHEKDDSVLLIKGDVYIKGFVNNAWLMDQLKGIKWKNNLYGVVIDGSLTIDGDLIDDEYLELTVTQNLICDYVFSGNGIIEIKGNADVRYGIYGEYNDGSLAIHGKLTTPYLISYDHSMPRTAEGEFVFIDGGNGTDRESLAINTGKDSRDYYEDSQKLLSPAVWDDADEFSTDNFFAIVRKGESPFVKIGG